MATYYPPTNFITLTLNVSTHPTGLTTGATSITVNEDISSLQTQGYLNFDRATVGSREIMKWTSKDNGTKTFTVTRGADGSTARTHTTAATIVISGNAAYFTDLKTFVTDSFASPPAIGATAAGTGAFTILNASSTLTAGGIITATVGVTGDGGVNMTSANVVAASWYGHLSQPTIINGTVTNIYDNYAKLSMTGTGICSYFDGYLADISIASGATLSNFYGFRSMVTSAAGTIGSRYLLYDSTSAGSNEYFLVTVYSTGGFLSGATTHDTEINEIRVWINGTSGYLKVYAA